MSVPDVVRAPGAFAARALAARDAYNRVLARAVAHGADRDVLTAALHDVARVADPLADRLAADAFAATSDALVEAATRLVAQRRWRPPASVPHDGPGATAVPDREATALRDREATVVPDRDLSTAVTVEQRVLLDVVPRLLPWLAAAPAVAVAAVVDGARAVGGGPGARGDVDAWAERVVAAAHASDDIGTSAGDVVRRAVLVAAWRSGLVRYRRAALDAARGLPDAVGRAALSLPDHDTADLAAVLDRHAADPWWWPGRDGGTVPTVRLRGAPAPARVLGRFGGFRGFGGPWLTPALVVGADARHPALRWHLLADDGGTTADWTLVADVHGSFVARDPHGADAVAPGGPEGVVGAGSGVPAPPHDDDLADVSAAASVDTPSGRLLLASRTGSYDVLLVRWDR